jgi:hypothetical protein
LAHEARSLLLRADVVRYYFDVGARRQGILQNDFAVDVVFSCFELVYEGASSDEATQRVIEAYGDLDSDEHEAASPPRLNMSGSLAEAATPRRLVETVKTGAPDVVASCEELDPWNGDLEHQLADGRLAGGSGGRGAWS